MSQRVVIVTGANSGIGFAITKTLLEAGYNAAGIDLQIGQLSSLKSTYSDTLLPLTCDITDPMQVEQAVNQVIDRWERVDILVNNACLAYYTPLEERTVEDIRREVEVNLFGALNMIRAVLPVMKKHGDGIIHNLSSGVGLTGFVGMTGYTASKGAIESLSRTLALEFEPYGISVTIMHPPLTNTPSASGLGVPAQMMARAADVGRNLARKIERRKPVITSDFQTALFIFMARLFSRGLGRLFSRLTLAEREKQRVSAPQ